MTRLMRVFQQSNGGVHLFPPLIWKFQYEFDLQTLTPKLDHLFSLVEKNSVLEVGDAISTVSVDQNLQPHGWNELEHFQIWLGGKIAEIRRAYDFVIGHSEVTQSWCNRHRRGGQTSEHTHSFGTFVASCYIKAPSMSGNIEFKDPLEYHKSSFPIIPELSLYRQVEVSTNDVLIFPGWLKHRVQPSQTDEERIVMTFNIK